MKFVQIAKFTFYNVWHKINPEITEVNSMASVFDVANYILQKCGQMTTMKLEKMVYYCQAWSLVWDGVPLFDEEFEAWANGPVCPQLFQSHKGLFVLPADYYVGKANYSFLDSEKESMDIVITAYGDKTPQWLSELTHSERPWKDARKGYAPGAKCDVIIQKEDMQDYYGGLQNDKRHT